MSGLIKNKFNGTFVTVRSGSIVKKTKDPITSKWLIKPENIYKSISGFIRDLNVVTKTFKGETSKELQVTIDAPVKGDKYNRFTLSYYLHKPFTNGMLLSLANSDLTKEIKITPYIKKQTQDSSKPTPFCATRYAGEESTISWIKGFPEIELLPLPDGTQYKNKQKQIEFIEKVIEDLKEKLTEINKDFDVSSLVSEESDAVESSDDEVDDDDVDVEESKL